MKGQAEGGAVKAELKELKIDPRPAPPYRARVKMADKETQVTPERDSVSSVQTYNLYSVSCLLVQVYLVKKDVVNFNRQALLQAEIISD